MNRIAIAKELAAIAKSLASARMYTLIRDVKTKAGVEFKVWENLVLDSYDQQYPYQMRLSTTDGRKLALSCSIAYKVLKGFPKPPSLATLEKWSNDGVAKAVDGSRVEPDGISGSGAPSWLLVMGLI